MKKIISMVLALGLSACGGGGGSSPVQTTFSASDFSAKSVYLVDKANGAEYELATFAPNGTGMSSGSVKSGSPVANSPFLWSVVNGQLTINASNAIVTIVLVSNDSTQKYYKVTASANNAAADGGIFYDQDTGLAQAQKFVADNGPL